LWGKERRWRLLKHDGGPLRFCEIHFRAKLWSKNQEITHIAPRVNDEGVVGGGMKERDRVRVRERPWVDHHRVRITFPFGVVWAENSYVRVSANLICDSSRRRTTDIPEEFTQVINFTVRTRRQNWMTKLKTSEIRHIIISPTIVWNIYQQFPKVHAVYNILVSSESVLNT